MRKCEAPSVTPLGDLESRTAGREPFGGQGKTGGSRMEAPTIMDHISRELARDASIRSEARKAREERGGAHQQGK